MSIAGKLKGAVDGIPHGGGLFLKLADNKDSAEVLIVGEPITHMSTGMNGKPRGQVAIEVIQLVPGGEAVARILDQGRRFIESLSGFMEIKEESGTDWSRTTIKITRNGKAKDQNTTYLFDVGRVLSDAALAKVHAVERIADVSAVVGAGGGGDSGNGSDGAAVPAGAPAPSSAADDKW